MLSSFKLRKSAGVPVSFEVHRFIAEGNKARASKSWAQAAAAYREALGRDPSLFHIWLQYGHALKESGEPEKARTAYLRAAQIQPQSGEPLLHLGHLQNAQGQYAAARKSYIAAAQLNPHNPEVFREVHRLAAEDGSEWDKRAILEVLEELSTARENGSTTIPDTLGVARSAIADLAEQFRQTGLSGRAEALEAILADAKLLSPESDTEGAAPEATPVIVFDVSDLMSYFRNARLPTGIQRVQIETITSLLRTRGTRVVKICAFVEGRDAWVEVPPGVFGTLAQLALANGDRTATDWLAALSRLQLILNMSDLLAFPRGATLINLGTSWWLQNYFLFVRQAKAQQQIRYIPFVHDLIPVMTPEHCTKELTQDFISWLMGAFEHADSFLVNSEATKKDLISAAELLGHTVEPEAISVVRLDADFRKPEMSKLEAPALSKWGLGRTPFVLFVSTVESRKNHLGAFEAWIQLIRRHGLRQVPKLVCVGNRGWLNDAVYARLDSHEGLRESVLMLSGLSDAELALLYRSCLFTLYPSRYEGWGLPVTESLCYGKTALLSDASSLPEAGGEFATYFDVESAAGLVSGLEKLIYEPAHRRELEGKIAAEFRPREWSEIGDDMVSAAARWASADQSSDDLGAAAPIAKAGAYHPLVRNFETRIWRGMRSAEVFRANAGWWGPDNWGCWTKAQGGLLKIGLPERGVEWRFYLRLHGLPRQTCRYEVSVNAATPALTGVLQPGAFRWLTFNVPADEPDQMLQVMVQGGDTMDLATVTDGLDPRVVSVGVCGFFLCAADDAIARNNLLEAVALDNIDDLAFNREPPPARTGARARGLS